jgi:hypothetical protein
MPLAGSSDGHQHGNPLVRFAPVKDPGRHTGSGPRGVSRTIDPIQLTEYTLPPSAVASVGGLPPLPA